MSKIENLKRLLLASAVLVAVSGTVQAADVGVSISVGQPGFYGRIDIGDYPQPYLIYPEPRVIYRPAGVVYEPLYLHVPPGHAKRWRHYCSRYDACDRPVYFVQDQWYNEVYVPRYRERHDEGRDYRDDRGHDEGRGQDREHGNHGHDRGRGHERD